MPRCFTSLLIPLLLVAAGCSSLSREARLEERLKAAGVSPVMARCLAHRLAKRLTNPELRTLADAAKHARGQRLDAAQVAARLEATDPHVADVVGRAALHCAVLG